jgi:hypothetical protein
VVDWGAKYCAMPDPPPPLPLGHSSSHPMHFAASPSPLAQNQTFVDSPPSSPESPGSRTSAVSSKTQLGGGRKGSVSLQLFKETVRVEETEGKKSRSTAVTSAPPVPTGSGKVRGWTTVVDGTGLGVTTTSSFKSKGRDITHSTTSPFTSPDPNMILHAHPRSPYKSLSHSPRRHSPSPGGKRSSSPLLSATASTSTSGGSGAASGRIASPRMTRSSGSDLVPEFVLPKAALSPSALSFSSSTILLSPEKESLDDILLNSPLYLPSIAPESFLSPTIDPATSPHAGPLAAPALKLLTPPLPPLDPAKSNTPQFLYNPQIDEEPAPTPAELNQALLEVLDETREDERNDEELFSHTEGSYTETGSDDDDEWSGSDDEDATGEDDEDPEETGSNSQAQRRLLSDGPSSFTYPLNRHGTLQRKTRRRSSDEDKASSVRRVVTVPLEPFDHQVGGHSHIFRFSKKAVCKVRYRLSFSNICEERIGLTFAMLN